MTKQSFLQKLDAERKSSCAQWPLAGGRFQFAAPLWALGLILVLLLIGAACGPDNTERPLGEGYAGAGSSTLRDKLGPGSTVVGSLQPGEHVVIYQRRRRWVRVRSSTKKEGWVDDRTILPPEEFAKFQAVVRDTAGAYSQGQGKARSTLNLHLDPDRKSPAFYQLTEGETCDVLQHRVSPKPLPPGVAPPAPPAGQPGTPGQQGAPGQAGTAGQPGQPAKPGTSAQPPATGQPGATQPAQLQPVSEKKSLRGPEAKGRKGAKGRAQKPEGPAMEDWYLIRGKGKAGWALARMVDTAIPDDVAQYAEGQSIAGWRVLDEIQDGDQKKAQYLWATTELSGLPCDFTGIRVFIWNTKHHRYETSYRERSLQGLYPLNVGKVELKSYGMVPSFTITSLDDAGNKVTREFVLLGNVVRRRDQVE